MEQNDKDTVTPTIDPANTEVNTITTPEVTQTPLQPPVAAVPQTTPPKSKLTMIIALIVAGVMVLSISLFFVLKITSKDKNKSANNVAKDTQKVAVDTKMTPDNKLNQPATTTVPTPSGWVTKTRKCFSFAVPSDNDLSAEDNSCILSVHYGEGAVGGFSVIYFVKVNGSTSDNIAAWKQSNSDKTIMSEEKITVGGLPATKLVHHSTKGYYTQDENVVIFIETGTKYKIEGTPVNGFEINSMYDERYDSKKTIDQVLSTWKWL